MKTVVGLFDTHAHAEIAAHDLERIGISHHDISLLANNIGGQFDQPAPEPTDTTLPSDAASETGKGVVAGGVAGLVLGLVAFAIPGLGAVAAAGWLTTMVTGAVVGAGVGLVGALNGAGVPDEEAAHYIEGVRRGGTLVAVRVEDSQADRVAEILNADGAVNIDERAAQYRQEGVVPAAVGAVATEPVAPTPTAVTAAVTNPIPPQPVVPEDTPVISTDTSLPESDSAVNSVPHTGETVSPVAVEETRSGEPIHAPVTEPTVEEPLLLNEEPLAQPHSVEQPIRAADLPGTTLDLKPQIERRAYALYEQAGRRDGHALDDWLQAEQEIMRASSL